MTNPSLMRKAGISDFEALAKDMRQTIKDKTVSLKVFPDEFPEMKREALKIAAGVPDVYVLIFITNTRPESSLPLKEELASEARN